MDQVLRIDKWLYRGIEYKSLEKVQEQIENDLGKIIDSTEVVLTAKQRLAFLKCLISNKEELAQLLYTVIDFNRDGEIPKTPMNILNFK